MKPFRFTLRAVHTLRENQERTAEERYAQALSARTAAVEELSGAQKVISTAREGWAEHCRGAFVPAEAIGFGAYFARLEQHRRECEQKVTRAEADVELAMQWLIGARQARECVDKLCQKQKAAHDRALMVAERKLLDEMGHRPVIAALRVAGLGRDL